MNALLMSTLILGLSAGLHCLFMCGPLALALPVGGLTKSKSIVARLLFLVGRWLVYMLMGTMAAYAGRSLSWTGLQLPLLYGLLILAAVFAASWNLDWSKKIRNSIRQQGLQLRERSFFSSFLLLGMANGLLPCGMVYAALTQSVLAASAWKGALLMLVFGLSSGWWYFLMMAGIQPALGSLPAFRYLANPRAGLLMLFLMLAFRLWHSEISFQETSEEPVHSAIPCRPLP